MVDDDVAVIVAVFGQGIDFNNKMNKGIIDPNQCRSFGVQCVDDPTYTTRKIGVLFQKCVHSTSYLRNLFPGRIFLSI